MTSYASYNQFQVSIWSCVESGSDRCQVGSFQLSVFFGRVLVKILVIEYRVKSKYQLLSGRIQVRLHVTYFTKISGVNQLQVIAGLSDNEVIFDRSNVYSKIASKETKSKLPQLQPINSIQFGHNSMVINHELGPTLTNCTPHQ